MLNSEGELSIELIRKWQEKYFKKLIKSVKKPNFFFIFFADVFLNCGRLYSQFCAESKF